ncbi:hypothetical protein, partial [Rhodoblastus sp.]|uniref:hypothetical protein n=1 Tax=Rhodoblastus sp. TaxID=1962975 RepID=UPI003F964B2A
TLNGKHRHTADRVLGGDASILGDRHTAARLFGREPSYWRWITEFYGYDAQRVKEITLKKPSRTM